MLCLCAAAVLSVSSLPQNARFEYSGLPWMDAASDDVVVPTHSIEFKIDSDDKTAGPDGTVSASSTTVFKNPGKKALSATLYLPRRRVGDAKAGVPNFEIQATWSNKPLSLATPKQPAPNNVGKQGSLYFFENDLSARISLKPGETCALRVAFKVPLGRGGYSSGQRILGYLFGDLRTIGQANITYRYVGQTVFRLPEPSPDWGWQIGERGAFVQKRNFRPSGELTTLTFYPGGFDPVE